MARERYPFHPDALGERIPFLLGMSPVAPPDEATAGDTVSVSNAKPMNAYPAPWIT